MATYESAKKSMCDPFMLILCAAEQQQKVLGYIGYAKVPTIISF